MAKIDQYAEQMVFIHGEYKESITIFVENVFLYLPI